MNRILSAVSLQTSRAYSVVDRLPVHIPFLCIVCAALLPRLYFATTSLAPVACDEIFQTIEVGHRITFGRGFLAWEWREGVRSYIMPAFFALLYRFFDVVGVRDPLLLAVCIKSFLAVLHAVGWAFLFPLLSFIVSPSRAFTVALFSALLYGGAFISVRTLGESVSIPFLIISLFFAQAAIERNISKSACLAGLFAGVAFAFRFQAIFFVMGIFAVLFIASPRRYLMTASFSVVLLIVVFLVGFVDYFTWGRFFQSLFKYVDYNLFQNGASRFGEESWDFYLAAFTHLFPPALLVPTIGAVIAGLFSRRLAVIVVPLLIYTIVHVLVPHKEVRFLFPSYVLFGVLVLFAWEHLSRLAAPQYEAFASLVLTFLAFLFTVPAYAGGSSWAQSHPLNNAENMEPSFALGRLPDIEKGVVLNLQVDFSGGHAYFHAPAEIVYVRGIRRSEEVLAQEIFTPRSGIYFAVRKGDRSLLAPYEQYIEHVTETDHWLIVRRDPRKNPEPRVVSLRALSQRQKEGMPWDAPGTVRCYGNGLRITLGEVRHDAVVDVAVDHNDRYTLSFLNRAEKVGELSIAPRPQGRGLFVHRLAIPGEAVEKGYDAVLIVPSEGDGVYSVGHLFFFGANDTSAKP